MPELKHLEVRRMKKEDAAEAARIEAELFTSPWSQKSFEEAADSKDTLYVSAVADGQMAGYCGLWKSFEEGEITNVAVDKSFQNLGIGGKLLEFLIEEGKQQGITAFLLEVRKSNAAAIHLYEKMGFVSEGVRKNFYERPQEDAVIMWRREL